MAGTKSKGSSNVTNVGKACQWSFMLAMKDVFMSEPATALCRTCNLWELAQKAKRTVMWQAKPVNGIHVSNAGWIYE